MPFQPFAYVVRRTLQVSVVIVEHAAPIPVEYLADQVPAGEAQAVIYYILRVHMIRTRDGFAEFACPIHRSVMQKERLF